MYLCNFILSDGNELVNSGSDFTTVLCLAHTVLVRELSARWQECQLSCQVLFLTQLTSTSTTNHTAHLWYTVLSSRETERKMLP